MEQSSSSVRVFCRFRPTRTQHASVENELKINENTNSVMNKIGVHALTFIGDIENSSIEKCLSKVAKIGYDVMELPLLNPDALDTNFVSKAYNSCNNTLHE